MEEPEQIVECLERFFSAQASLKGKKVLITAGPTYEKIDPVRFVGNYSSGKMGFALAEECASRGAEVEFICGPVSSEMKLTNPLIHRIDVESASQMYESATALYPSADAGILCAAVADYTPVVVADRKLKKSDSDMSIELKRTKDIAKELGAKKGNRILVGFALETDNEEANAEGKLERKNFDFVVLNSLRDKGAGFGGDTNKVTLIDRNGREEHPLMSKSEVAAVIVDKIERLNK